MNQEQPIPIVLVAGFLGSGKTTLMRRLIRAASTRGFKAAVVVNEFGIADIDSHILNEADAELIASIAGGCACCTGQDDLLWTLADIGARRGPDRPDVILMEASGLADPILLLDSLTVTALLSVVRLASLVTVVDHSRFLLVRDEVAPLMIRQLQLADHIVLNKIDIAHRSEDRGTRISELVAQLRELNAHAAILPAKGCEIDDETIWARVADAPDEPQREARVLASAEDAAHAHYQTVICPMPHPVERWRIEAALQGLPADVWRAKGFLRLRGEDDLMLLQYSGGSAGGGIWQFAPFRLYADTQELTTTLVFIGPTLDRAAIFRDFAGVSLLATF